MGLFGLIDYEDYLLKTVIKSSFTKKNVVILLMYLTTHLLKFHLETLICYFFVWNTLFDYVFPVLVNIILTLSSALMFQYISTHKDFFEHIVIYFIDNYSFANYIKWKRYLLFTIWLYVIIIIKLTIVNNFIILVTTLQTAVSFIICEIIEQKVPQYYYRQLYDWWTQPTVITSSTPFLIDNYELFREDELPKEKAQKIEKVTSSPPRTPKKLNHILKPPTPPKKSIHLI
jgi:hypothetical protein